MFPGGFSDERYLAWERDYKLEAHRLWREEIGGKANLSAMLAAGRFRDVATAAARIESSRSLLFSFEKMALRDAVRTVEGARAFARGLFELLHGTDALETRFGRWVAAVESLPRRQTRVLTWPMVTVWGFLAQPRIHFFVKPMVTRAAAEAYGYDLAYRARPNWETYAGVLRFAATVRGDLRDLRPRDMIDLQSFLWVQGSDEYA